MYNYIYNITTSRDGVETTMEFSTAPVINQTNALAILMATLIEFANGRNVLKIEYVTRRQFHFETDRPEHGMGQ